MELRKRPFLTRLVRHYREYRRVGLTRFMAANFAIRLALK
jgi:hypothetical protein